MEKVAGGIWVLPTGRFIRDYLMEHGEAYPYEIYLALKDEREFRGFKIGSPTNLYRYFYILRELGAIRKTGKTEPSSRGGYDRIYYEITPGFERRDNIWRAPQKVKYHH